MSSGRGIAFVLCVLCTPAQARETFRIEHFDIRGATARELRADLGRVGPVGETGIRGDGYTEYRIAWRFTLTSEGGACRAHDIEVDLDVRMLLPRWHPPPGVSAELLRSWDRFSERLRAHEDGHHRLAIEAAREVRRQMGARGKGRDCKALEARLNATANEVLREYRDKQADYDRRTDFGRAEGGGVL